MSINTTQQTGVKVITGVTATGGAQATAYPLGPHRLMVEVSSVPSGSGVMLPSCKVPSVVAIKNADPSNTLSIYPPTGGTINNGAVNASFSLSAGSPTATFWCSSPTNWYN